MPIQITRSNRLTLKERARLGTLEKRRLKAELKLKELEAQLEELDLQINRLKRRGA